MKQRGRPPSAALSITAVLDRVDRIKPPHDLSDEECEVWAAVVNDQAADWFSATTAPLLAQYCRHTVQCRRIAELLERATSDPELKLSNYNRLLAMQDRESRAMTFMATKMRLTQQSTLNHNAQRVGNKSGPSRKPWEG